MDTADNYRTASPRPSAPTTRTIAFTPALFQGRGPHTEDRARQRPIYNKRQNSRRTFYPFDGPHTRPRLW